MGDTLGSDPTRIEIESGLLSGTWQQNGTRTFLGIPYAAPPVKDLRWRPPQPLTPWDGVRLANKFGASSLQIPPPTNSIFYGGETEFSEDCLFLNIWTGPEASSNRPVLVWFHYGAFLFGSGSSPLHNGTNIAAQGITVITVNYRLGRFGNLAHRELSAESEHQASGNYGIMDQIAALKWVQRNIAAFGGNPKNVTIGGVSAGGASVHILRTSPLAEGLFSKAICESGPGVTPTVDGPGHIASYTTLAAAEKAGGEVADLLGASSIAELRDMPADKILAVRLPQANGPWKSYFRGATNSLSVFDTAYPIVDGYVLPESPLTAFLAGKAVDVPLIAGAVSDDGTTVPHLQTLAEYETFTKETFKGHTEEVRRVYPATTVAEVETSSFNLLRHTIFVYPMWTTARLHAKYFQSPVWYYQFCRKPPIPGDSELLEKDFAGSFHLAGAMYAFGLDAWKWNWTDADRVLSKNIMNAWVRFMDSGSPNEDQENSNVWPDLKSSKDLIRIWSDDGESRLSTLEPRAREETAFWDAYYGIEGHID
ncbi:alpha/beta-hydrolase [Xylariaceae sp. FL1272]|nr:alpha/beta-hydrolase [Xylariaceae sp. FL1272]